MKIGAALVLLAVGAILRFAVATTSTHGLNVPMIGNILMIVGAIGLVLWLIIWAPWTSSRRYPSPPPPADERGEMPAYRYDERYR